jgi:hypothetical protein
MKAPRRGAIQVPKEKNNRIGISGVVIADSGPDDLVKAKKELESKSISGVIGIVVDLGRSEIVIFVENSEAIEKIPKEYKNKCKVIGEIKSKVPEKVREVVESKLIAISGVSGISHDEKSIIIYVETEEYIKAMPSMLSGVPVRYEVIGKIWALEALTVAQETTVGTTGVRTDRIRPVLGGISLGNPYITAGTLSIIDNNHKILSNAHVIAMDGNANFCSLGTSILQPGPYDRGKYPRDRIGRLEDYVYIKFMNENANNFADAAIGALDSPDLGLVRQVLGDGGNYAISGCTEVETGDSIRKSGRTTGVTIGYVYDTQAMVQVFYTENKWALFKDQILVMDPNFVRPGDSGSLVDKDGAFAGLVFAGSELITVICKANYIIAELGIDVEELLPLVVSVSTNEETYSQSETVIITATVTGGTDLVSGASVHVVVVTGPRGRPVYKADGTTAEDGTATFQYTLKKKAKTGDYKVTATASIAGYASGSDETTFEVTKG